MIPSGQSWEAEATSSRYSSFFWPSHSFINLSFLPLAPFLFVFYIFTDALPATANPFASHFLTLFRLSNILPYQSSTELLWFLHYSSSSASSLFGGLTKQTASSKWNLKLNSDLRGFFPQGKFPSGEATVYTGRCLHTGTQKNTLQHMCKYTWICIYTYLCTHRSFPISWAHIFFTAKHCPCASCVLQLWTLFVPVPNCRMKATELSGLFSRAK